MTPWVMRLIIANAAVFLMQQANFEVTAFGALVPAYLLQRPWTAVSYMFLHADIGHIFFNMLTLWFFGPPVEARLGGRRFLTLYFLSGLSGALLSLATPNVPIIGASGAIFGVSLGFAWFWPRQQILMFGVFPIEARWLILLYVGYSFIGIRSGGGNIAHYAHLGGFVGAWLYLRWVAGQPARAQKAWKEKLAPKPPPGSGTALDRWKKIDPATLHPVNREEYDRVMAKVNASGVASLSPGEWEFMDRFSQQVH